MNAMKVPRISKVTVNMGVGEGGERLAKAEALMEALTGLKPKRTFSTVNEPSFGIRKGLPIACMVTLRDERVEKFLEKAFGAVDKKLKASSFDESGNISFGIKEHIDIPGERYDPKVGIFGMDVSLTIERPGYRIKRRRNHQEKPSKKHRLTREDSIEFLKSKYGINIEG
jgi:large subunit ribosomal protein L5